MTVDVSIEDYSQTTLEKFSILFASIPTDAFQAQSMQILQKSFENDNKPSEFEFFVASTLVRQKMFEDAQKAASKVEGDPIIEPTDLI